jgi:two-component system, LytTR family, response regulator
MIQAILIDDEQGCIHTMQQMLLQYSTIKVVASFTNPLEATAYIQNNSVDVVFLDISMPQMNGIEWLASLASISFSVVFTTAYHEYALQAIKLNALDYLLKPIDAIELAVTIEKLQSKKMQEHTMHYLQNLQAMMEGNSFLQKHKMAIATATETHYLEIAEIIYATSTNSYTTFFTTNGKKLMSSKSIKEYEMLLNKYGFLRVHQSYLINKNHVQSVTQKDGILLKLTNGYEVPVSRNNKHLLEYL